MNATAKAGVICVFGCLVILMSGCATTKLVNIWHDPSFQAPPFKTMLVIAVRKDAEKRHRWEDAFSEALAHNGVAATPSYRLFPDHVPDTNQVIASVHANGFDAIITISKLPSKIRLHPMPPYLFHGPYWRGYSECNAEEEAAGELDTERVDFRAFDVIATEQGGHLIWKAISRTRYADSLRDVHPAIARKVVADLVRRKIIGGAGN